MVDQVQKKIHYQGREESQFLDQVVIRMKDWLKLANEEFVCHNESPE